MTQRPRWHLQLAIHNNYILRGLKCHLQHTS